MSDAWNTPGWTAQHEAYYYTDESVLASWKLPADVETVKVTAEIGDVDGGRSHGYVMFKSTSALLHVPSGRLIQKARYIARISPFDGRSTLTVPATDSTVLVPMDEGFEYEVEIVLGRSLYRSFTCHLPKAVTEVNLFTLAPTDEDVADVDGGGPDSQYVEDSDGGAPDSFGGISL